MEKIEIYLEVISVHNPGPAGWGVVVWDGKTRKGMSGYEAEITHHRTYLIAAISVLEELEDTCEGRLHTDSKYLCDGITTWIANWEKRSWQTYDNKPVKNADLWKRLKAVSEKHQIEWVWNSSKTIRDNEERKTAFSLAGEAIEKHLHQRQ